MEEDDWMAALVKRIGMKRQCDESMDDGCISRRPCGKADSPEQMPARSSTAMVPEMKNFMRKTVSRGFTWFLLHEVPHSSPLEARARLCS